MISTFQQFLSCTYCLKCYSAPGSTFFPFHTNFAELACVFFSILHSVCHRTQARYRLGIDTGITCELASTTLKLEKTCVFPHETKRYSILRVPPKSEQKWRSNETIILDTKIGNLPPKK